MNLSRELLHIRGMLSALLSTMGGSIPLEYLLLDGKFGHNAAVQMTCQLGLHLVSKLRYDVDEVIKLLPQKPEPILISRIKNQVANLGAIHSIPVTRISPE